MKKIEIIKSLSNEIGFSNLLSKEVIDNLLIAMRECISENKLVIKNIGSFKLIQKEKRVGRNPKTKESFIISARKSISYKPSKTLTKKINEFKE